MKDIIDALAAVVTLGWQAADLEDELRLAVVEEGQLRVGGLALIGVTESAAEAEDALGQRGAGDHPAGLVHLVDALVADVAVAEIPEPMPIIMHQIGMKWSLLCGPEPEVEIQFARRGRGFLYADART